MINDISFICNILQKENNFLISAHIRPEGDSIGSQLALGLLLQQLGKRVIIINEDPVPESCRFLPQSDMIKVYKPEEAIQFDVACILDCSEWDRIGKVSSLAKKAKIIINIDHHPDHEGLGNYNYIDSDACATGEQIYEIIKDINIELTKDIALCLYTAIWVDTGGFRHSNSTAKAHQIAADLIEHGVFPPQVYSSLSEAHTPAIIKLTGLILSSLKTSANGKVVSCHILHQMLKQTGIGPFDVETDGVLEQISFIKAVKVVILFRELPNDKIKISMRSKPDIDISLIAKLFGGGGHRQAAGCVVRGGIHEIEEKILNEVSKLVTV